VTSILKLDPVTQQRTREPISNAQISRLASILSKEPYKLLSTEVAGVINQIPRTSIELCLIVEEGEERFKEEELEEIVALVAKYLVEGNSG
jgi:DNA-directed RNA polymerase subunit F